MPIHHRVPIILAEGAKRLLTAEAGILNKAWYGFKHKSEIVSGIRTGLAIGAGIGSFIEDDEGLTGNGSPELQQTSSSTFNKTRGRRAKCFSRTRYGTKRIPCKRRRRSYSRYR